MYYKQFGKRNKWGLYFISNSVLNNRIRPLCLGEIPAFAGIHTLGIAAASPAHVREYSGKPDL